MKIIITQNISEIAKVILLKEKGMIDTDEIIIADSQIPKIISDSDVIVQVGNRFENITSVPTLTDALNHLGYSDCILDPEEIEFKVEEIYS